MIGFVTDTENESFQITKGDVVRVPSSVTHFFANTNGTVPLRLAKIAVPANVPGHFQVLYLIFLHLIFFIFLHLTNFNMLLFNLDIFCRFSSLLIPGFTNPISLGLVKMYSRPVSTYAS